MSGMSFYEPGTDDIRDAYMEDSLRLGESATLAARAFNKWLDQERAMAWDEGHEHCLSIGCPNPYRGDS